MNPITARHRQEWTMESFRADILGAVKEMSYTRDEPAEVTA